MTPPTKKPIFISLVGKAPQTDRLYAALETKMRDEYPHVKCAFVGDPFEHYSSMKIDEMPKHDYESPARTFFRLGLFYQFNAKTVKPVFDEGVDLVVVRAYGYDLYHFAIEYQDCGISLEIHKKNLEYTVLGHGICPPVYLFTQKISPAERITADRYFKEGSGQKMLTLDPSLTTSQQIDRIISMYRNGMLHLEESRAA